MMKTKIGVSKTPRTERQRVETSQCSTKYEIHSYSLSSCTRSLISQDTIIPRQVYSMSESSRLANLNYTILFPIMPQTNILYTPRRKSFHHHDALQKSSSPIIPLALFSPISRIFSPRIVRPYRSAILNAASIIWPVRSRIS